MQSPHARSANRGAVVVTTGAAPWFVIGHFAYDRRDAI